MPNSLKNNTHPRDANISFEAGPHIYTIAGEPPEKKYTSVTTWNHQHFAHFDADAIIAKMQLTNPANKYYGQTPAQIKAGWDKNRDEAADAGTKMHYLIECYYNYEAQEQEEEAENPLAIIKKLVSGEEVSTELSYFHNFVLSFNAKFPQYRPYRTEWMIYHEELQLSGSVDMVFENTEDGTLFIYDWKRAKEIKKSSPFIKFALTDCISHLPDTNFWHYALQLNTYKAILEEKYEKKVTDLMLVVLHPDNKNYQMLQVPFLEQEIAVLFALRKEQLRK
jgi:hypothetical protein